MANYFYLSSAAGGGTTGNSYATQQTGTFTALTSTNVFSTLAQIVTAAPATGDFVCVSDSHSETIGSGVFAGVNTAGGNKGYHIVSVDEANCETYTPSASTQFTITAIIYMYNISYHGIRFGFARDIPIQSAGASQSYYSFDECYFDVTGGTLDTIFNVGAASATLELKNCTVANAGTTLALFRTNGIQETLVIKGLIITGAGTWSSLIRYALRSLTGIHEGCDYSVFDTLCLGEGGATGDDIHRHTFTNCELKSGVTHVDEQQASSTSRFEFFNCTDSTADNPNQFYIEAYPGTLESYISATGQVRTDGEAMDMESGTKYLSIKAITNSNCTLKDSLRFSMPVKRSELSSATSDIIRIYLTTATTLYEEDVTLTVSYRDGTNVEQIGFEHSVNGLDPFPLATTELTTDSASTWSTALTKSYQIDTPALTGGLDQYPIVTVYIKKPSITIYFDSEYDLV